MEQATYTTPNCTKPGTQQCSGCKTTKYCSAACQKTDWGAHKQTCPATKKVNCFLIRATPSDPASNDDDDASYIEPFPLANFGDWIKEMGELKRKLNWSVGEAGTFYSHRDKDISWYYYVYSDTAAQSRSRSKVNKVASRCLGTQVKGDVAVVRSGPADSSNYPEEFSRLELVATAGYYHTANPKQVFTEREKTGLLGKMGMPGGGAGVPHVHMQL